MNPSKFVVAACLFIAGLGSFLWAGPKLERLNSPLGQLASSFASDQDMSQFTMWKVAYYGGILAILVAVVVAVAAFLKKP